MFNTRPNFGVMGFMLPRIESSVYDYGRKDKHCFLLIRFERECSGLRPIQDVTTCTIYYPQRTSSGARHTQACRVI